MTTDPTLAQARLALQALLDKKALNPVLLDVRRVSSVTDFYLIATGNSAPHLKALAEDVDHQLRAAGIARRRRSGESGSGWLVLDGGAIVVHLFLPTTRAYYALEDLWSDAPRVE